MKKAFSIFFITLFVLYAGTASAAVFGVGDEYTLKQGEIVRDDLYSVSGNVVVSGTVFGDLVAGGWSTLVNGPVSDDVLALGCSVDVLGRVGDDLRAIGCKVTIGEDVAGDVVVAGGIIHLLSDATIGGSLVVAGNQIIIDGTVRGNVRAVGAEVTINGSVAGDIKAEVSEKVVFGNEAVVSGNVEYSAPIEAEVSDGAVIRGALTFEQLIKEIPWTDPGPAIAGFLGAFYALKILGFVVIGALAVLLFARFSADFGERAILDFGKELLRGFVVLIVTPFAIALLFATVLGSIIGVLGIFVYLTLLVLAGVYAGILCGAVLARMIKKQVIVNWKWAVLGIVVLSILRLVPFFGWIFGLIFFLVALGYLSNALYESVWLSRKNGLFMERENTF